MENETMNEGAPRSRNAGAGRAAGSTRAARLELARALEGLSEKFLALEGKAKAAREKRDTQIAAATVRADAKLTETLSALDGERAEILREAFTLPATSNAELAAWFETTPRQVAAWRKEHENAAPLSEGHGASSEWN